MKIKSLVKWTIIGLAIRLLIMPFTMHGQDIFFVNYFPSLLITKGIWDPYGYIRANIPFFYDTYYGPVLFIILSAANFVIIKLLNLTPFLKMLEIAYPMMFGQFTTSDYLALFSGFSRFDLFRNLFLAKGVYLVFDFLTAAILLKMASKKSALGSYKLWMLNVVVLHSVYAVGQADIITAFFITAALYFAVTKMPYASIFCLALGGATKTFPFILILPTCLLLGNNWAKRLRLALTGVAVSIALYLPFWLSSGGAVFTSFTMGRFYMGPARYIFNTALIVFYCAILLGAKRDSLKHFAEKYTVFYFLAVGFLVYAVTPISFRYFVFITPLLALVIPGYKRFGIFILFFILMLAFLRLPGKEMQLGLLAPLNPQYFMNLPGMQEIVGKFIDIEIVYRAISRILVLSFFAAAFWTWRIKVNEEKRAHG